MIFSSLIAGSIMYGLVTLLPLCSVILQRSGFHAGESQLLMIFMVGITLTGLLPEVSQISDATQFLGHLGCWSECLS